MTIVESDAKHKSQSTYTLKLKQTLNLVVCEDVINALRRFQQ